MGSVRYTQAPARRAELLRRLSAAGYVSSAQVADEFGVSEMTIRRDLRRLATDGQARRVVGGASLPGSGAGLPFEERDRSGTAEKLAIARAALTALGDAATVALDAGTTVAPLAKLLPPGTTVITHSVPVIAECARRGDLDLIALGGTYQPGTRSFTGPTTRANLETTSADVAILSATAVDASGALCANSLDAEVKRTMAGIAPRTMLLVDHSKLGARAPIRFATPADIDVLVTDGHATADQLALARAGAGEVIVAE